MKQKTKGVREEKEEVKKPHFYPDGPYYQMFNYWGSGGTTQFKYPKNYRP